MLLLPIIRNISIRPVRVYTRITPHLSIPPSKKEPTPSLIDDSQDMTYFDIRIKLDRCETDAPSRLKKLESHSSSQSEVSSPLPSHETTVEEGESLTPTSPEGEDALRVKEKTVETQTISQQKLPAVSTLYSIGAMIGTALYYGSNKAAVPLPETQSRNEESTLSFGDSDEKATSVISADSSALKVEPNPYQHPDEVLLGGESEEGRPSDQSISSQSAVAADRIRERLARLRK